MFKRIKKIFSSENVHILLELIKAQFRLMEHNSVLGNLWHLITPISIAALMFFVFYNKYGESIQGYPVYIFAGCVIVNFFSFCVMYLIKGLDHYRDLACNTVIMRENYILALFSLHGFKVLVEFAFCLLLSIVFGVFNLKAMFLLVPISISFFCFTVGVGFLLTSLFCFISDIEHVWMILSKVLLFMTPVFYSLDSSSLFFKTVIMANPLSPFVIAFQSIFVGDIFLHPVIVFVCLFYGMIFLVMGYTAFLKLENYALERV